MKNKISIMFVLVILSLSLACNRFERSEVFETKLRQKRTEIQIEFDSIILRNNFVRYIDRLIEYENLGMDQRCEVEQVLFVTRVGILLPEMIDIFYPENESSTFDLEKRERYYKSLLSLNEEAFYIFLPIEERALRDSDFKNSKSWEYYSSFKKEHVDYGVWPTKGIER